MSHVISVLATCLESQPYSSVRNCHAHKKRNGVISVRLQNVAVRHAYARQARLHFIVELSQIRSRRWIPVLHSCRRINLCSPDRGSQLLSPSLEKKTVKKRLALKKLTIRDLDETSLSNVVGGTNTNQTGCCGPPTNAPGGCSNGSGCSCTCLNTCVGCTQGSCGTTCAPTCMMGACC